MYSNKLACIWECCQEICNSYLCVHFKLFNKYAEKNTYKVLVARINTFSRYIHLSDFFSLFFRSKIVVQCFKSLPLTSRICSFSEFLQVSETLFKKLSVFSARSATKNTSAKLANPQFVLPWQP